MTCCISCHLNTPFHMVIDHPIIVIPEYVLGRSGSWAQNTCQWYRGSLIHMILFSALDVGLRIDNIEMNSSWNCPSWSWHLTLIDSGVSVLDKLYLQKNFVLIEYIPIMFVSIPVEPNWRTPPCIKHWTGHQWWTWQGHLWEYASLWFWPRKST